MNTKNAVILATLFAAASASGALDFSAFVHKAAISFPGYTAETTQADFPALVRLADGDGGFTHAACALAGGADVRFATTDGVELPSTGGEGTQHLRYLGMTVTLGAALLLMTRQRQKKES